MCAMVKRAAQKVRVALVLFVPSMEIFFDIQL